MSDKPLMEDGSVPLMNSVSESASPSPAAASEKSDFEHLSEDILSNIGVGIYIVQKGRFIYVSSTFQKLSGYSEQELLSQESLHFVYPPDHDETRKKAVAVLKRERSEPYEYRFLKKNGDIMWILEMVASLTYQGGQAVLGSFMDITGHKNMETSRLRNEAKYRTILEEMDNAYFEVDLAGYYTFVNDAITRLLGYEKDELIGTTFRNQVNEEDTRILYHAFGKIFNTGQPERGISYKAHRKDGTFRYAEISAFPIYNQNGDIVGFRGIGRDVTERKLMEETLRQSEERYRTILEEMDNAYFEVDLAGNYTFVNDAISRLLGYSKEELITTTFRDQVKKEDVPLLYQAFSNIFNTGHPERGISYKARRKNGEYRFAEISGFPIYSQSKDIVGFRGIGRDVTDRKLMEENLRQSEERYRTLMEEMDEWYFEADLQGNILFVNDAAIRALDHIDKPLVGENFRSLFSEKEADAIYDKFHLVFETGKPVKNFSLDICKPGDGVVSTEFTILPKRNAEGRIFEFRGVGHDVTERKRAEKQIQYLATHDNLTGLPNRVLFSQLLNHAIQSARRYQRTFAVFFIDLDRFKIINDTLGHDTGDMLLREISIRFKQSLRAVDTVARLGGDEFVILVEEVSDINYVTTVANKILSAAIKPMMLLERECRITASVGISLYPRDGEDEQTLMKNADIAMYFAKEEGKNNFQFYSQQIKVQSIERLFLEAKLRSAMERNEFSLQYQAKLDVKTGAITGMEALLRWYNPKLGSVPPIQFLPVAEETGMIVPIGRWVLKTACAQNVAWQRQGLPSLYISVNLSLRQLTDEHLVEDIETALKESGMNPNLLELEITEGMLMNNPVRMGTILEKVKNLGVRLAIDNFGTGYSSLSNIRNFPIDALKIDRSFVRNIMDNIEDKAITKAIISMGKTLSLNIVAEGVENNDQMTFLQEQSCDEMQGFHFSKPVEPDKVVDLLKRNFPPSGKKD